MTGKGPKRVENQNFEKKLFCFFSYVPMSPEANNRFEARTWFLDLKNVTFNQTDRQAQV